MTTNKEQQCTCPHEYKPNGLMRYGTDYRCKVHGKRETVSEELQLRNLLAGTNGALIGLVQELEKSGHRFEACREIVKKNCVKLGTNNPLEE